MASERANPSRALDLRYSPARLLTEHLFLAQVQGGFQVKRPLPQKNGAEHQQKGRISSRAIQSATAC